MYCPECGTEYREGFTRCADCDADLATGAAPAADAGIALVKVFETSNAAIIPFVQSLLGEAGIEFLTRNENLQDLFGGGRIATGFGQIVGPVQYWVREEDASAAEALLAGIDLAAPGDDG